MSLEIQQQIAAHRLHPQVVKGQDMMFLSGGNHHIEDYLLGLKEIPEQSFQNFHQNLKLRRQFAYLIGARYAHLVCPDKHSVYPQAYPFSYTSTLAERYQERGSESFIYPVSTLKDAAQAELVYRTGDSHWNDYGALLSFLELLNELGLDIEAIQQRFKWFDKFRMIDREDGDLSVKLDPPYKEHVKVIHRNQIRLSFDNKFNKNNGVIKASYNKNAFLPKVILLFADSYLETLIPFFNDVFEHVIFVCSPFFYPDMAAGLKPDFMVSSQAERYLSFVESDQQAGLGFLAALNRGHNLEASNPLYAYLDAVASRNRAALDAMLPKVLEHKIVQNELAQVELLLNHWAFDDSQAQFWMLKSKLALKKQDSKNALTFADRAAELSKRDVSVLSHLSTIYLNLKKYDEVVKLTEEILDRQPKIWVAHRNLAHALIELKQLDVAEQHLQFAFDLSKGNATVVALQNRLKTLKTPPKPATAPAAKPAATPKPPKKPASPLQKLRKKLIQLKKSF